jgi:glycosyltransferase involved in cell wall biosynthesis
MLGNDSAFFAKKRSGSLGRPIRVGYTTWKSGVGDEVAALLKGSADFVFRAIRNPVGWGELRALYHWSDVFLGTPLAEEGFYMPGLEAMAAGAVVISPDAGGNMAYCEFGENCLGVGLDDAAGYVEVLEGLRAGDAGEVERLRRNGYETVGRHTLEHERDRFGEFMGRLTSRLDGLGPGGKPPPWGTHP